MKDGLPGNVEPFVPPVGWVSLSPETYDRFQEAYVVLATLLKGARTYVAEYGNRALLQKIDDALAMKSNLQERDREHLSPEGEQESRSLLTGTTTSTVTQVWACGHQVGSVNGDSLYASCPICFTKKREEV